jgi:hypothetical protein
VEEKLVINHFDCDRTHSSSGHHLSVEEKLSQSIALPGRKQQDSTKDNIKSQTLTVKDTPMAGEIGVFDASSRSYKIHIQKSIPSQNCAHMHTVFDNEQPPHRSRKCPHLKSPIKPHFAAQPLDHPIRAPSQSKALLHLKVVLT